MTVPSSCARGCHEANAGLSKLAAKDDITLILIPLHKHRQLAGEITGRPKAGYV